MTTEDLHKIGIEFCGSKLNPRKYFIPSVGEIIIPEFYTIENIFRSES